jgi:hypothetical protein
LKKVSVDGGGDKPLDGFKVVGTNASHWLTQKEQNATDRRDVKFDDTIIVDKAASGRVYGSIPSFGVQNIRRLQLFANNGKSQDQGNNRLVNNTGVPSFLVGGAGRDLLAGGTNNDYLIGGAGKDWLWGNRPPEGKKNGSDILLPDHAYTPPADPDAAVKPYGSLWVVNGDKGDSGDQLDGDRAYADGAGALKQRDGGDIDKAVYSGLDTLARIEQWNGKGGRLQTSMWLRANFLSPTQRDKLLKEILEADLVKPFPKGPNPQPAAVPALVRSASAAPSAPAATKGAAPGPQPEYAAALMSVLASDFPTTPFARDKKSQ